MKLKTIALASALAMSSTFALAQAGGGTAGTSSGPAVNGGSTTPAPSTATGSERMQRTTPGETTGAAAKPGGMDESKPGGQSTARKPPG